MASSSKQKNSSHKCCAAVLCNNRSDNRPDLIFHNFPLDENLKKIWDQNKKIASNSSLFCCSEHFSEKDYRKSLTGKRRDLVKNAVPSIFPWSVGNDKPLKGPKETKVGNAKGLNFQRSHPRVSKINITHTMHLTSLQRRLKRKIQVKNHLKKRDLIAKNYDLKQRLFLS